MKAIICQFFVFSALWCPIMAQNLVPDPGFESYIEDPEYSAGGIIESFYWFSTKGSTPDYFNDQYELGAKPPDTYRGYQDPSSGNGFAGIIAYLNGLAFEYLSVELLEFLVPDQIYDIRFDVNLSNESRWGTDGIGAYILDHRPHDDSLRMYEYTFRNKYGDILADTVNWVTVEGQFRADGGEKYLLIGGKDRYDDLVYSDPIIPDYPFAYYFIDNVYLAPCEKQRITRLALDTTLCKGNELRIEGLADARSYQWNKGGVKPSQIIKTTGTYILDNHYDCEIVQQVFVVKFDDCDCNLNLPTLVRNIEYQDIQVSPIVENWRLSLFDAAGQQLISTNDNFEGLSDWVFETSGPYFWLAQLQCWDPNDQLFSRTMSGKIIIQN